VAAIRRAPLTPAERRECMRHLRQWLVSRSTRGSLGELGELPDADTNPAEIKVKEVVGGRKGATA
jgi:hypothetical protein